MTTSDSLGLSPCCFPSSGTNESSSYVSWQLLSQIGQRILVTKTCPERMWPAKDVDGIFSGRIDSEQLNTGLIHPFDFSLPFKKKVRLITGSSGPTKVSVLLTSRGRL